MAPDGKVTITGGAMYHPQIGPIETDRSYYFKCPECHDNDPVLRNYMPTDVYSRVVGYLTPTRNWNDGKLAEFKLRSTYKIEGETK